MRFGIGTIKRIHGDYHEVTLDVDGKPFNFNIGNYPQYSFLINYATHGMFHFDPQDQFAYFIPMSEVNVMLTQAFEQARLAKKILEVNAEVASFHENVVDATA